MAKKKAKPVTKRAPKPVARRTAAVAAPNAALVRDLREMIAQTRRATATAVNAALVLLYWQVGTRIRTDVLKEKRAEYGAEILSTVSKELVAEYGNGYSVPNLSRMMRLAEVFSDLPVVTALSRALGWSHFVEILVLKEPLKRDFYAEMCRVERWSVRTLRAKIDGLLYERTALSRKPEELARAELDALRESDRLSPDLVFRDPYFLDFLGLRDTYSEADIETAILREMERFLTELGGGFAFVARQKRMAIDGEDFYLDLLFYHRKLRRLIAIDLKLGRFQAADKGQMELYLRWLEKHEAELGEEPPLGLILCEDMGDEQIELLQLDRSGIRVAGYLTELPPKAVLGERLKVAAELARERAGRRTDE